MILLCIILVNAFVLVGIQGTIIYSTHEFSSEDDYLIQKLDYKLRSLLTSINNDTESSIRIIIHFQNATSMVKGITRIRSLALEIQLLQKWQFIPAAVFKIPTIYLKKIASLPEVRKIWLDREFYIGNFQGNSPNQAQTSPLKEEGGNVPITTQDTHELCRNL